MFHKLIVKNLSGDRMKKLIIFMMLVLWGCVAQPKPAEIGLPKAMKPPPFEIKGVTVAPRIFNPTQGEMVDISFSLTQPGQAIIMIFDQQMGLINDLSCENIDSGNGRVIWDGTDLEGRIVPDEAYFFTVEAITEKGDLAIYDPTTISGGEYLSPQVTFDSQNNQMTYELPKDARVMIRAGITGGALLKNIVNGAPRLAGKHEESWDGRDSGVIDIDNLKGFKIIAEAVSLPENSIIACGNPNYGYFEYNHRMVPDRPKKKERPLFRNDSTPIEFRMAGPREPALEPAFSIHLPEDIKANGDGLPILRGKIPIRIILDKELKTIVTEHRYEIISFVDFKFVTEEEGGYSPFTWMWDTKTVRNGEHILTINLCTLKGGKSSNSIKVVVDN